MPPRRKPKPTIRKFRARLEKNATVQKIEAETKVLVHKEHLFLRKLKRKHKFLFAILVFFGVILLWAGAWQLINMIPFLNEPFVSITAGIVLLLALGYFYENIL